MYQVSPFIWCIRLVPLRLLVATNILFNKGLWQLSFVSPFGECIRKAGYYGTGRAFGSGGTLLAVRACARLIHHSNDPPNRIPGEGKSAVRGDGDPRLHTPPDLLPPALRGKIYSRARETDSRDHRRGVVK